MAADPPEPPARRSGPRGESSQVRPRASRHGAVVSPDTPDLPPSRDCRARLAGGVLAFTVAGSGPVVVLVHGLGGSRHTWRHVIGPLAAHHTVIAVDLPGHGDSAGSAGGYSPGAHAATIRDLLDELGIASASLVGHSLGGGIAVQFAHQFPERTERLALVSSAGFGADVTPVLRATILPGVGPVLWGLGHLPTFLTRLSFAALASLTGLASRSDARPVAEDLSGMSDARRRRGFLQSARAGLDRHGQSLSAAPFLRRLPGLPVLLVWGTGDKVIPPDQHHELARSLPADHVVEIADAGHYPQDSEPAQLVEPLLAFLATTPAFHFSGRASSRASRA